MKTFCLFFNALGCIPFHEVNQAFHASGLPAAIPTISIWAMKERFGSQAFAGREELPLMRNENFLFVLQWLRIFPFREVNQAFHSSGLIPAAIPTISIWAMKERVGSQAFAG